MTTLCGGGTISAKETFIQHYQKADGTKEAPAGLIKAANLYVLKLKTDGFSLEEITERLQALKRSAGGQTPETARLDADILLHCIEQFHRPLPAPHPKPPDFVG